MINESRIDVSKKWYLGNNRAKNLRISKPQWNAPFFLTDNKSYAAEYADYGVWEVKLDAELDRSKILDFSSTVDIAKLNWPKTLIDQIKSGDSDMNAVAYELYVLAQFPKTGLPDSALYYIEDTKEWRDVAEFFKKELDNKTLPFAEKCSHWEDESDYTILLRMWADIFEAGFDGFTHREFGNQILALFDVKFIDKISTKRIDESALVENKATYLQKFKTEPDAENVVDKFWTTIRHRVSAPQNDIDWWIKKPFADFKRFVLDFDMRNKSQKRDADIVRKIEDSGAQMLGEIDGYEIWHVPTYEASVLLGRDYKNRPTHWCISSDDPSFWFENYDQAEFLFCIRKELKHDEKDKIAIEFQDGGKYFNVDEIEVWDLDDNTSADTNEIILHDDFLHEAWQMFKAEECKRHEFG